MRVRLKKDAQVSTYISQTRESDLTHVYGGLKKNEK